MFGHLFILQDEAQVGVLHDVADNEWEVAVKWDDGEVTFTDGWKHFVIAHGINRRDTLFFQYVGKLRFRIHVLCQCNVEIIDFEYVNLTSRCPNCQMPRPPLFPNETLTHYYSFYSDNPHCKKTLSASSV